MHYCNVRSVIPRLQASAMEHNNELGSLYYNHQHWWAVIEDIFGSPSIQEMKDTFTASFLSHDEYVSRPSFENRTTQEVIYIIYRRVLRHCKLLRPKFCQIVATSACCCHAYSQLCDPDPYRKQAERRVQRSQ